MKRPNYNHFADAPSVSMARSAFDHSFTVKTTFNSGYLVPCMSPIEILPGDTCNFDLTAFARLSTLIRPIMDNLYMQFFFFFVPNRLVMAHWPEVMGAREDPYDPDSDVPYLVPRLYTGSDPTDQISFAGEGGLWDYFGLPPFIPDQYVNVLPFRAYNLIYNEWFRPASIVNSVTVNVDDNDEFLPDGNYLLRKRAKRADAFTRALPWPQRGPGVELPLGSYAPVMGNGLTLGLTDGTNTYGLQNLTGSAYLGQDDAAYGVSAGTVPVAGNVINKTLGVTTDSEKSGLVADLSNATAATINSLRQAFQVQKLYERDARSGGNRYIEILRAHFGVISPDARLQRPEYLGGGVLPINIHTVTSTNNQNPQNYLGKMNGNGVVGGCVGFRKSFVEHGFIIGIVNVFGDQTYQQGISKMWSRRGRFDYYWPTLAHLGEEPIYNKEIYADGNANDNKVFGYQERYYSYRYGTSICTSRMRSNSLASLDSWHLAQNFANLPTLNQTFVEENIPLNRVKAVNSEPDIIYDSVVKCTMVRCMPVYAIPGLVDHF